MLFPGHRYLGPGNKLDNSKPIDTDDAIALEHDIAYSKSKTKEDIFNADKKAIHDFTSAAWENRNYHSAIGALGLGAKHVFEKYIIGQSLYPSMSSSSDEEYKKSVHSKAQNAITLGREKEQKVNVLSNILVKPGTSGQQRPGEGALKRKSIFPLETQIKSPRTGDTPTYSGNSMPVLPGYNDAAGGSMDVDQSPGGGRAERAAVSRAGSGPGMGSLGTAAASSPSIFTSKSIPGTPVQRTYRTTTRWILPMSIGD